jgi:hypothetical protein
VKYQISSLISATASQKDGGQALYARQILTPISFRDTCRNPIHRMRTPTAGNRGGLNIEDIMKAKGTSMFFWNKGRVWGCQEE